MVLLGVDSHKDTHTVVAVDPASRQCDQTTVAARTLGHAELLAGHGGAGPRSVSGPWRTAATSLARLERDLLAAGERVVRVPPRLLAGVAKPCGPWASPTGSTRWRSPRTAPREPALPAAGHDQASWEVKLLVDHREHLVAERTRVINRLRWHLHQLDPDLERAARRLPGPSLDQVAAWLAGAPPSIQVAICQELTATVAALTACIDQLTGGLRQRVARLAPTCSACPAAGC